MSNRTVESALQAFKDVERVRLLLAKKEAVLSYWTMEMARDDALGPEDKAYYAERTQRVIDEYDEKHGKIKVGP